MKTPSLAGHQRGDLSITGAARYWQPLKQNTIATSAVQILTRSMLPFKIICRGV
uniref:Uncharacterized protein n=1 Tax=Anguilla anguilla TaxID=7936 RepID=A0A0E9WLL5_ANGAN